MPSLCSLRWRSLAAYQNLYNSVSVVSVLDRTYASAAAAASSECVAAATSGERGDGGLGQA